MKQRKKDRRDRKARAKEVIEACKNTKRAGKDVEVPRVRGDGMLLFGKQAVCPFTVEVTT